MTEIHYALKHLHIAIALVATVAASSCSDEDSLPESIVGKEIRFEIAPQATGRSIEDYGSATAPRIVHQPLTLVSQTNASLYLIPTVTSTPVVTSTTDSRSTLTAKENICSAGVYATMYGLTESH